MVWFCINPVKDEVRISIELWHELATCPLPSVALFLIWLGDCCTLYIVWMSSFACWVVVCQCFRVAHISGSWSFGFCSWTFLMLIRPNSFRPRRSNIHCMDCKQCSVNRFYTFFLFLEIVLVLRCFCFKALRASKSHLEDFFDEKNKIFVRVCAGHPAAAKTFACAAEAPGGDGALKNKS